MSTPTTPNPTRLDVRHLSTFFDTDEGLIRSVADVSFQIHPGRTTALVGESGSGKSVTSLTLMRLLSRTASTQVSGEALFTQRDGRTVDLLQLPESQMRAIRGNEIAMIFQEPMTSLNPVFTVGEQIAESARLHLGLDAAAAMAHAQRMLELVEIPAAAQRVKEYPHQLSGGMRQRVMIALAMACNPTLLIADEPTTALDVTIQAQILALMRRLQAETGMGILFITHNLGVVAHHADEVAVMYAGRIVEAAPVGELFAQPRHPYTQGLLACLPAQQRKRALNADGKRRLYAIRGQVSSPLSPPPGCAFAPRCDLALPLCQQAMPALVEESPGRRARCVLPIEQRNVMQHKEAA
ncbi:peptide/nickel transport system ATP-binding protein [Rhodoferax sp. OV413]|uniref:ABC transporter ATP-binding protein n=1 Tax=Rhodoferax sp. OV413 TaxID=1855285 RepID=UPI00088EE92C|nr:ABC transporter ATP-binding protein [Rhodoferax sp. OV413]SDP24700.1 peptide/nickel transport system ATP-binding protein [Rhodoferax sp. OV413]